MQALLSPEQAEMTGLVIDTRTDVYADVLETQRQMYGAEHQDALETMANLAGLYTDQGPYAKAEPLLMTAFEARLRTHGEEDPETLTRMNNLAMLYQTEGKLEQAEPLFSRALRIRSRASGGEHPETLTL
jgi:Tfp pilus assembly protein PilF